MHYIVGKAVVAGPVEEVFDLVAGVRPDTRFAERAGSGTGHLGRVVEYRVVEYVACQRPYLLTTMTAMPGAILHDTLRFEPTAAGTCIRRMCSVELTGAGRLLGPVMGRLGERRARRTWAALTAELAGRGSASARPVLAPSLS